MKLKRRAFWCLTHSGVKAFTNASVLVLLPFSSSSHDHMPVSFDLKSAFYSLCLEPRVNTVIPIIYFYVRSLYVRFYPCWSDSNTPYYSTMTQMWIGSCWMNSVSCWLDAHTCLYWYCAVYEALKTSDDSETREQKVREWASEEFTSCQLLLLWSEQSSCYAVSWRERDKGNYLGECNTHNMVHTYKLHSLCKWCSE